MRTDSTVPDWKVVPLKHISQLNPPVGFEDLREDSEVTFLPMDKIKAGFFIQNTAPLSTLNSSYNPFKEGDILIAKVTPCFENGNIALADGLQNNFGFGTSEIFVIRAIGAYNKFLFYYFQSLDFKQHGEASMTGASGLKRVSPELFKNHHIKIPEPDIQNAIVKYLDRETARIDALIAKKENMLSLLEEKLTAIISQAVTRGLDPDVPLKDSGFDWIGLTPRHWKILPLKRVSTRIETGATPSPKYMDISTPESCIWFTPGDFEDIFIKSSKRKIPCEAITDKQAKIFPAESIMVIGIGATLGKVASCLDNFSANQQINIICPNNDISAQFLLFLLSSYKYVFRAHANSATLPILNQRDLGVIHIPLPPKHEQLAIVEKINNDQIKTLNTMKMLDRSIQILKQRRSALITAAVTGQIPIEEMTA